VKRLVGCWLACWFAGAACRSPAIPEASRFPAGTGFTARRVTVDGTTLRYIDEGRGTPVVLLHGLGASMYSWRKNIAPVVAAGYRVIAFDNRGFGFSDKPATGYDNASYARLTLALLDSLHLPDAVLIGHSMGGAIAAEVAIAHPERVRGLVLIGSAGLGAREPLLFRVGRWPLVGPALFAFRSRGFTERFLKATYADPRKVSDADVDQYYAPVAEPGYGRALRAVLRRFRFDGLAGRLDRITVPTLVLWGEADRLIPITLGRALAAGIPRAAFLSVPGAGHSVQEEAPDEVNRLVIRFLKDGLARVPGDLALGDRISIFPQPSG
jgi:pimeloyl-ACP methyl ester carboxylesterase